MRLIFPGNQNALSLLNFANAPFLADLTMYALQLRFRLHPKAMRLALQTSAADGHHVPLGGPEALVGDQVAANLAEAIGREVRFESLAPEEFAARMSAMVTGSREVTPLSIYDGMAKFYAFYNTQAVSPLIVDPQKAADLLGMEPTRHLDWARAKDWCAGLPG